MCDTPLWLLKRHLAQSLPLPHPSSPAWNLLSHAEYHSAAERLCLSALNFPLEAAAEVIPENPSLEDLVVAIKKEREAREAALADQQKHLDWRFVHFAEARALH